MRSREREEKKTEKSIYQVIGSNINHKVSLSKLKQTSGVAIGHDYILSFLFQHIL
jgi:hypothetical protein